VAIGEKDGEHQVAKEYAQVNFGGYGNCVVIRNDSGERALYAHMNQPTNLTLGSRVTFGETVMGLIGNT